MVRPLFTVALLVLVLSGCKGAEEIVYVPVPVKVPVMVRDTTFYPVMRDFVERDSAHVRERSLINPDSSTTAEQVAAVKLDLDWYEGFIKEIMAYFRFWIGGHGESRRLEEF